MPTAVPVFLVEDAAPLRDRLSRVVASTGRLAVVGTADTADGAVEGIRTSRAQLVILDLQLARGSGWDVLSRMDGLDPKPSVIVFSNHADPEYRKRATAAGVDGFFDKSTEFDAFVATISAWAA